MAELYVSIVILCHHCHSCAVVRLVRYWREVALAGQEHEFPVSFVSCAACMKLPGVHDPSTAYFRRYVDPELPEYTNVISSLKKLSEESEIIKSLETFGRPSIQGQRKILGFPSFVLKTFARVRDVSEIVYVPAIPEKNIVILCRGQIVPNNCGFFRYEPLVVNRSLVICPYSNTRCLELPEAGPPRYDSVAGSVRYTTPSQSFSNS
jgi:hypothetical protein